MTHINQSLELDFNNHSNKENFSVILDYSNENSLRKCSDKKLSHNDENKINQRKINSEKKLKKSCRNIGRSSSIIKKEKKILSMKENNSEQKHKNLKYKKLPLIDKPSNNTKNNNFNNKDKIELKISLNKKDDKLNSELKKFKNKNNMVNINTLENNCKIMFKELESLRQENKYIKNKLENISKKQNASSQSNYNPNIRKYLTNNDNKIKNNIRNIKKNLKQNNNIINNKKIGFKRKSHSNKNILFNINNINPQNDIKNRYNNNLHLFTSSNKHLNQKEKILTLSRNITPNNKNKNSIILNIKRVKSSWRNKIPLLTSFFEESEKNIHAINSRKKHNYFHRLNEVISGNNKVQNFIKIPKHNLILNCNNNNKKVKKTEYEEKFLGIKNRFSIKKKKMIKNSESYNDAKKILETKNVLYMLNNSFEISNELNEKNNIIKKLNNNLLEHNKITEKRISLLIKDKRIINERLLMLQREKEEYKMKKDNEIKKYIYDINSNKKLIKELNYEKEKLLKSKRETEQLNQKLKSIILEEKNKRYEYEYMLMIHKLNIDNKNITINKNNLNIKNIYNINKENEGIIIKNEENLMKLKYDIMIKKNKEMKNQLISLQKKLEVNQKNEVDEQKKKEENKDIKEIKNKKNSFIEEKIFNDININNIKIQSNTNQNDIIKENSNSNININLDNSKIFLYQDNEESNGANLNINKDKESLKNISHSSKNSIEGIKECIKIENNKENVNKQNNHIIKKIINNNNSGENLRKFNNIKKVEMININTEEIKLFNKHINYIEENRQNQIKIFEMEKEISENDSKISDLEKKILQCIKAKEDFSENINKVQKEKEDLNKDLMSQTQNNEKIKEFADNEEKKYIKYKAKFEEYQKKANKLMEQMNKRNILIDSFILRGGSSVSNKSKTLDKLKEDIFQLKDALDEEKNKNDILKIVAENEREINDNIIAKFQTAKKLNNQLINKLKERDINISKGIKNENNLFKKQIAEKDKKIDELKNEIKKLNNDINSFKKEIQKKINKEKDYIKEKNILKENLNKEDIIIKESNTKINDMNLKYNEEKNKNLKLSEEIEELNLINQKLIEEEKKKIPKRGKEKNNNLISKMTSTSLNLKNKKDKSNKYIDLNDEEKNINNNKNKNDSLFKSTNKLIKYDRKLNNKTKEYFGGNQNKKKLSTTISKTTKEANKRKEIKVVDEINEMSEDYIIVSNSNSDKSILEYNKINTINSIKINESYKSSIDSNSISDDNQKKSEKINSNNHKHLYDKIIEKAYSSFKDDKSTKIELEKVAYSDL